VNLLYFYSLFKGEAFLYFSLSPSRGRTGGGWGCQNLIVSESENAKPVHNLPFEPIPTLTRPLKGREY
jgi:hypothetical protein